MARVQGAAMSVREQVVAADTVVAPAGALVRTTDRRTRSWWSGRFGHRLVTEFLVLFSLLTLYRFGRYVARNNVDEAFHHATTVAGVERWLGLATEQRVQQLVLDHVWLVRALNRYYATVHFPATVIFLVIVYVRAPAVYRRLRNVLVGVTAVALVVQMTWPLAPPRMLPGFVDTIDRFGPTIYDKPGVGSIANQYAAMPSLHVGWALVVAVFALRAFPQRPWRYLGVVHCAVTVVAVVGTANHWWLDAVAGAALVSAAVTLDVRHHRLAAGHQPTLARLAARIPPLERPRPATDVTDHRPPVGLSRLRLELMGTVRPCPPTPFPTCRTTPLRSSRT